MTTATTEKLKGPAVRQYSVFLANRVGALIALKAFFVDGIPADEALELGKQHGLTRMEAATRRVLEQGR